MVYDIQYVYLYTVCLFIILSSLYLVVVIFHLVIIRLKSLKKKYS